MATPSKPVFDSLGYSRHKETVGDGATSEPVLVPQASGRVSVGIVPSGTAKIQFTLSSEADIVGDSADWFDWADGNVTSAIADTLDGPVSAVRCVSVSSAVEFYVLFAQRI